MRNHAFLIIFFSARCKVAEAGPIHKGLKGRLEDTVLRERGARLDRWSLWMASWREIMRRCLGRDSVVLLRMYVCIHICIYIYIYIYIYIGSCHLFPPLVDCSVMFGIGMWSLPICQRRGVDMTAKETEQSRWCVLWVLCVVDLFSAINGYVCDIWPL